MDYKLFKYVFNNIILKSKIFNCLKEISFILATRQKYIYKWKDIVGDPMLLVKFNYDKIILELLQSDPCSDKFRLLTNWPNNIELYTFFSDAVHVCSIDFIIFLIEHFRIDQAHKYPDHRLTTTLDSILAFAARFKRFDLITYLLEHYSSFPWDYFGALTSAPFSKHLETVKMFYNLFDTKCLDKDIEVIKPGMDRNPCATAAKIGDIEIMKYLAERRPEDTENAFLFTFAVWNKHPAMVRYLLDEYNSHKNVRFTNRYPLDMAVSKNLNEITIMLIENNCVSAIGDSKMIEKAISKENIELVKWLHSQNRVSSNKIPIGCVFDLQTMIWCEGHGYQFFGNLDQLLYFKPRITTNSSGRIKNLDSWEQVLEIIIYLKSKNRLEYTAISIDKAAAKGSLAVLKFLHGIDKTISCTTKAMNKAASRGFLDVVQFLHENRTEGCNTSAMDGAATSGSLEILKFLHENRTEGCTESAMNGAIRGCHVEVLEFLRLNRTEGFTPNVVNHIEISEKTFSVIKWLGENYKNFDFNDSFIDYFLSTPHLKLEEVQWLYENKVRYRPQILDLDHYFQHNHSKIIKWFITNNQMSDQYIMKVFPDLRKRYPFSFHSIEVINQHIATFQDPEDQTVSDSV